MLIGYSVKIILHFLLWRLSVRGRCVVFHHVVGRGAWTWLLGIIGHTFVISELHATDMFVKVDLDVVIIVQLLCG